ncbi:hypothetical protein M5689_020686 [Euphorbia peplus]|nr:hypothetical protein M5689_020686 [Euphorbia peplus]
MLNPVYRFEAGGPPVYDPGEDYFSLKLWWKGEFKGGVYTSNEGGIFDWCHAMNLSLELMDTWLQQFGFIGGVRYVYCIGNGPKKSSKNLNQNSDLFEMCMDIEENKHVDVFVIHNKKRGNGQIDVQANEEPLFQHDVDIELQVPIDVQIEVCQEGIDTENEERVEGINVAAEDGVNVVIQEDHDELVDDDYDIPYGDDDYNEVVREITKKKNQRDGVEFTGTSMGRPYKLDKSEGKRPIVFDDISDGDTDYASSDELHTGSESDEETRPRFSEFNMERDFYDPSFQLGMLFGNFKEFKTAVKNWSIKNRFPVKFETNDTLRCIPICPNDSTEQPCKFRINASKVNRKDPNDPTVQIKALNMKHTCSKVFKNRFANSEFLARKYYDQFRFDIDWSLNGIMAAVQRDTKYTITRQVAYRIKECARNWIRGEEKEQYMKLLNYQKDIEQTNPGSTIQVKRDMGVVKGFYMCLNPLKEGFIRFGRPLICIDGCFLKGTYGGQLLSAVTIDPNDCIYPIAWAVVTTESIETWTWFLDLLGQDLNLFNDSRLTFMSDRQKGLIRAVHDLFPEAEHRHCVRHIYTNFREHFKGKALKDLLWNCARASYVQRFDRALEALKAENVQAYEWLLHPDRPTFCWTRAYFKTHAQCDMLLNNLCECFNKYILDARGLPIISLNEAMKVKIMRRLKKKKDQMEKYKGKICPKVQVKLNKLIDIAANHQVEFSGGPRASVTANGGPYIVNLEEKTCTCRRWQLTGLPCSHAICAIRHNNQRVEDFVSKHYHVSTFMEMYGNYINPTNNEELWPEVENPGWLLPPLDINKKRGRKKLSRRKEPEEIEKAKEAKKNANKQTAQNDILDVGVSKKLSKKGLIKIRCSVCGKEGHNKRHHAGGGTKVQVRNKSSSQPSGQIHVPVISKNMTQVTFNDSGCITQGQEFGMSNIPSQVNIETGLSDPDNHLLYISKRPDQRKFLEEQRKLHQDIWNTKRSSRYLIFCIWSHVLHRIEEENPINKKLTLAERDGRLMEVESVVTRVGQSVLRRPVALAGRIKKKEWR